MQKNTRFISGGTCLINADSVKARLKISAKQNGHTLQDELTMYGLERTLYRISISKHTNNFTLKGGILLYALFDGNFTRSTTDIDLLARNTHNDIETLSKVFKDIFMIAADDALRYDLESFDIHTITEFKEYSGVNISIKAYLDRTKISISLDIGFGDVIYPDKKLMDFPVLLDMEAPTIFAYSIESIVAEKFEAFVQLGYANSRYKDFYDIYILETTHDFNGLELKQAIIETFKHRKTDFKDIIAFNGDFAEDTLRQNRWTAFIKKKKAITPIDFKEAIIQIKNFLSPVVDAITYNLDFNKTWNYLELKWK